MAELWFYHLERVEIEQALAPLLEKCLARGWRAIVRGSEPERLDALDAHLWTYRDDSFLPHARQDGRIDPARQPVLITDQPGNPNGAHALFLIDGAGLDDAPNFERACVIFDGRDEAALALARAQWKEAKAAGADAAYWRQNSAGAWEKHA